MISNNWYEKEIIEKLYPEAVIVPPQKIGQFPGTRGLTLEDVCTNGEYFANTKKDGYCYIYNKTPNHSYLFSRSKSRTTGLPSEKSENVPHIINFLDNRVPINTILIGEIYYPGGTSKDATTIMGCLAKKAIQRQENNPIHYYIHDVIMWDGENLMSRGNLERYTFLKENFKDTQLPHYIEIADCFKDCNLLEVASEQLGKGEEGIVLKKKDGTYHPGLRPAWETIKIKKTDTVDVVCMGFEDATKEYTGKEVSDYWALEKRTPLNDPKGVWVISEMWKGSPKEIKDPNYRTIEVTKPFFYGWKTAIKIGLYKEGELVSIGTVASGLTDFYREDFSKHPEKYLGKVIECKLMEKGKGSLRHPIFVRFRDDKEQSECLYEEVFK